MNPRLLYFRHAIPIANHQPKLSRPVEYDVSDIDRLELHIRCTRDVGELKEFLDCGEHGREQVAQVVNCFLHDVLLLKELVRN